LIHFLWPTSALITNEGIRLLTKTTDTNFYSPADLLLKLTRHKTNAHPQIYE
jgi:hypothetical protein